MTAVCGICVSNAVEENCYILMPGCGHVFDRACIINSLGVEYTCPECQNNYLLPSPYRPVQLSDSTNLIEYKELHKLLIQANHNIASLKDELSKAYENLSIEQRSRKKSNESLIALSQAFDALQEKYNNLNSKESHYLAVAVATEEPEKQQTPIDVHQAPSENDATSNPRNPVPKQSPDANRADKQPEAPKSKLLVHYNARIEELKTKIPGAQGSQKESFKQHLRLNSDNKAIVEKLHILRYISSKITANISYTQKNATRNANKHKEAISKLKTAVAKAKKMQEFSIVEKQDLQGKVNACLDKIFELEVAARALDISNLQSLKTKFQKNDQLLPDDNQMCCYSIGSKKLKKLKAKHANLVKINKALKQEKWQEKLEHILTESRQFQEKIDFHGNIIEQAEQSAQDINSLLAEISAD